jgi:hypothetical protein
MYNTDVEIKIKNALRKYKVSYNTIRIDDDNIIISIKGYKNDYRKFINKLNTIHIKLKSCTYGCWKFISY